MVFRFALSGRCFCREEDAGRDVFFPVALVCEGVEDGRFCCAWSLKVARRGELGRDLKDDDFGLVTGGREEEVVQEVEAQEQEEALARLVNLAALLLLFLLLPLLLRLPLLQPATTLPALHLPAVFSSNLYSPYFSI